MSDILWLTGWIVKFSIALVLILFALFLVAFMVGITAYFLGF